MVKEELIKRSPLRIFEKSIHGGLGRGNIGVLASRKGVGKTACLVHIATDQLLRGKHVIHVSFSARVDHIISWYEDIFKEIAKKRSLENAVDVHDDIIKNRVIMNFNQQGISAERILRSVGAMIRDGHFGADTVIFDGIACFIIGGLHFITVRGEPIFLKMGYMVLLLALFETAGMANRFRPAFSGDAPEVTGSTLRRLLLGQMGTLAAVFILSVVLLYLSLMVVVGFTDTLTVALLAAIMVLALAFMSMVRNL